jgi:nitrile hydratase subunit beta
MNGPHDVGGLHGLGRVERELNEPPFHDDWEKLVLAMRVILANQRIYGMDESRYGVERIPPAEYYAATYYERWLASMVTNLIEKGVITREELDAKLKEIEQVANYALPVRNNPEYTRELEAVIHNRVRLGRSQMREAVTPKFAPGERVHTININPRTHTRLPRYARHKSGVINCVYGTFVFPDAVIKRQGENAQPLYSVSFDAEELWGRDAEPNQQVYLDLWESYLEPEA